MWNAVPDADGNRLHIKAVGADSQSHHTGLAVQGTLLVEDEVAYTEIDLMAMVILDGLPCVGVMTHEHVGTGIDQLVSLKALTGYWLQRMFAPPVQRDNDDTRRVALPQVPDTLEQAV